MDFIQYQDLDVWKKGEELVANIYVQTRKFPKTEIFGLTQQIRRASVSIISNIAEGCGRNHTKDKLQFYYIARGSLFEVEAQAIIAIKLGYLSEMEFALILKQCIGCRKLLNGFISYHKRKLE